MPNRLFTPFTLRELTLANRIVVSPMAQYSSNDANEATDWHLMHYGNWSISGAGLMIFEATAVEPRGRVSLYDLGLWTDAQQESLARIVRFCREHGHTALGMQLAHAGRKSGAQRPWEGNRYIPESEGGWLPVGPGDVPYPGRPAPRMLDADGLESVKQDFVAATRRSDELGFELIELHAAHGYLLHSFLSPLSNNRNDEYGGDRQGRMRFPLEVFAAMRAAWPQHKPLGVRISATDWIDGGWTLDDAAVFCQELKALGCDYICASSGGSSPDQKIDIGPSYQVPFARRVREQVGIPTMAVGIITEALQAEQAVRDGAADLVALGRGMTYDPRWAWHAGEALKEQVRFPPQYARSHHTLRFGDFFSRPAPAS